VDIEFEDELLGRFPLLLLLLLLLLLAMVLRVGGEGDDGGLTAIDGTAGLWCPAGTVRDEEDVGLDRSGGVPAGEGFLLMVIDVCGWWYNPAG
jgi:hypothetical protein